MIVTVTPNPSVDRTIFIETLRRGDVTRSDRVRSEPSGKGVNVALALRAHGYEVLAVLPIGGATGALMTEMLSDAGLPHVAVPIHGQIRNNVSLVEPDGTVTKVNEAGPFVDDDEVSALVRTALGHAGVARWIACCGSLPLGASPGLYSQLVLEAKAQGARTAIDTSGQALVQALPSEPDLVKPNVEELAEAVGRTLLTVGDVVAAAEALRMAGAGAVLDSLGPDGAILVDEHGAVHGEAHVSRVVSAVGAGDALLAGFLAAGGEGRSALNNALAWAAAVVQHEGTTYSGHDHTVRIHIHDEIESARELADPARLRLGQPITRVHSF